MNENGESTHEPVQEAPAAPQTEVPQPPPQLMPGCPYAGKKSSKLARILLVLLLVLLVISIWFNLSQAFMIDMLDNRHILQEGDADQTIAVYEISGIIDSKQAEQMEQFYRQIKDSRNVKAIVLRVDSPGGTVSASTQIHHMIKELRGSGKPVIVSMGGVAASGGYMVAAPADVILAEESTITGSIGVIAQIPNFHGTLDKMGMKMTTIKSTHAAEWKDQLSMFKKDIPEHEIREMGRLLDQLQEQFEDIVRDGRGSRLKKAETAPAKEKDKYTPFNGKVFLAREAMNLGLVDEIGHLEDAIKTAEKRARLNNARVVRVMSRKGLLMQLLMGRSSDSNLQISADLLDRIQTPRILVLWKVE